MVLHHGATTMEFIELAILILNLTQLILELVSWLVENWPELRVWIFGS